MMNNSINAGFPSAGAKGQIQVIFGPMFSGKTTELIRRLKRYLIANYKCLIVKYAHDTRYDECGISTHDRQTLSAVAQTELDKLREEAEQYDVIGIDEGQFFPDIVSFCEDMANDGKIVLVAALDGTFLRKGFGDILALVPLAEHVLKLTAVCMKCYEEASYTKRKGNETKLELIGGSDKYMAVCRRCYHGEVETEGELSIDTSNDSGHDSPKDTTRKLCSDSSCDPPKCTALDSSADGTPSSKEEEL